MNYGKGIKIARSLAGLRQRELAKLAGVDPSHVSLIEKGKRQPSLKTLEKLSTALNIPHHLLVLISADPKELRTTHPGALERAARSLVTILVQDGRRRKPRRNNKAA
jgi:XRE family transcriptional regulator of biofilm formation